MTQKMRRVSKSEIKKLRSPGIDVKAYAPPIGVSAK